MQNNCFHCGSPISKIQYTIQENDEQLVFCCNGCREAYRFIQNLGLRQYYQNREDLPDPPPNSESIEESIYDYLENTIPLNSENTISYKEKNFYIKGLHCASCVWLNEKVLSQYKGVLEVRVSLSANRVYLKWDPDQISLKELAKAVAKIGYQLLPVENQKESSLKNVSDTLLKKMAIAGFFTGNNMLISASLYAGYFDYMDPDIKRFFHWLSFLFATPVFFYSATEFFRSAYHSIRNKVLGMDILTSVGISLAYFYSVYITITDQIQKEVFFDAVCFVVFAILIGRFIESRLKLKTFYYTTNLSSLTPDIVRVLKHHHYFNVINNRFFLRTDIQKLKKDDYQFENVNSIQKDQIIIVFPSEIVPVDSILLNPVAELDEASLTGEFKPIVKHHYDWIVSGSKNVSNYYLFLQVKKIKQESTVDRILELAEKTLNTKSRSETIAVQIAGWFIFFVLTMGLITFFYWYAYRNQLSEAILYTLSLLIVACPCALSLSIPTVMIVGVQKLFANGCLIQNSHLLEILSKVKTIAFDKTGTLTQGNLKIQTIYSILSFDMIREWIQKINQKQQEIFLQHPITEALYRFQNDSYNVLIKNVNKKNIKHKIDSSFWQKAKIQYEIGKGVRIQHQEKELLLGSLDWLKENQISVDFEGKFQSSEIVVMLGYKDKNYSEMIAVFVLKDELKEDAKTVIYTLNKKYLTILLTGDQKRNAEWVQKETQIQKIYFSLRPEDKSKYIRQFQKYGVVMMIGDGINDTIALKQADVGISFADASKLALYSADILLLNTQFEIIVFILELSQQVIKKIKQNLSMSFLYNAILLPMAFMGYLSPFLGAVFMSLSSITVVLNSLSIIKWSPSLQKQMERI